VADEHLDTPDFVTANGFVDLNRALAFERFPEIGAIACYGSGGGRVSFLWSSTYFLFLTHAVDSLLISGWRLRFIRICATHVDYSANYQPLLRHFHMSDIYIYPSRFQVPVRRDL
jgi:hypothetical protein